MIGFVFTIVYIISTILGPEQFGQEWLGLHPLEYLAGLTILASLPNAMIYRNLRSSVQTYLLLGFMVAIALSEVANGWFGGIVNSWLRFLPSAAVYFIIVANVTSVRRLKILTLATVSACLIVAGESLSGYYAGFRTEIFVLRENLYSHDEIIGQLLRVRGVGFLNDPNDFAQILLVALPLTFVAWRSHRPFANSVFVLLPAGFLLWAIYLTHSRGALVGLAITSLIAVREKLGTIGSICLTAALVFATLAIDFTGGRGISAGEGSDRLEAWATGLELFRGAPLLGIGFGAFTDFNDITAHNSLVLCLAELGLTGCTIWVALLATTIMGLNSVINQRKNRRDYGVGTQGSLGPTTTSSYAVSTGQCISASDEIYSLDIEPIYFEAPELNKRAAVAQQTLIEDPTSVGTSESNGDIRGAPIANMARSELSIATASFSDAELIVESESLDVVPNRWIELMRLSLVSLITTSWFLSRSYATPMYLILGLATASISLESTPSETSGPNRWILYTLATEVAAILLIYGLVRLRQ